MQIVIINSITVALVQAILSCSTRADCNNQGDCTSNICICDAGFTGLLCETGKFI